MKKFKCGIYEDRPEFCKVYPERIDFIPKECTFSFYGKERIGKCDCGISACCRLPREGGLPLGLELTEEDGGLPCKYVVEVTDKDSVEKTASLSSCPNRNCVIRAAFGMD